MPGEGEGGPPIGEVTPRPQPIEDKKPTVEDKSRSDRAERVDELQNMLREKNSSPEVQGKMLVEMPLGDGTDRVVQVLRPDAIDSVLPIMEGDFNKGLPQGSNLDGELVREFANTRIGVVLPEVGMAWIRTDRSIRPDTVKSEAINALDHQGRETRSFLELAKLEGLRFAVHRGMEQDDTPSYIPNEMMDVQGATIIQRNPGVEDTIEGHWQGGVAEGVVSTVRGNASAEMFDMALKGSFEKAQEQVKFKGPSPDKMIASSLATVQSLK